MQLIKKVSEVGFDEPLRLGGVSKRPIIEHGYIEISTIIIEFIKNIFKNLEKKTKILITGSAGFVGTNLIKHLSKNKKFEITATYNRKKPFKIKNVIYKKINLLDKKKLITLQRNKI